MEDTKVVVRTEFVGGNPFVGLVRSRKFWVAVLSLGGVLLAEYSGLPTHVQAAIVGVGAALIASIMGEDIAEKAAPRSMPLAAPEHFTAEFTEAEWVKMKLELLNDVLELLQEVDDGSTEPRHGSSSPSGT